MASEVIDWDAVDALINFDPDLPAVDYHMHSIEAGITGEDG